MTVFKVNGIELKLRFGMHLGEMLVQHFAEHGNVGRIQFMALLIYYAHENYCFGYDEAVKVTKGQVFVYLEDNNDNEAVAEELKAVIEAYNASRPASAIKEAGKPAAKKKVAPTKK